MNRLKRWFNRHDVASTKRKMKEWETDDAVVFFSKVFDDQLTSEEIIVVYFYFPKENKIDNIEKHSYI